MNRCERMLAFERIPAPHFVSTRMGGVSGGVNRSLNLSDRTGDRPGNVRENRRRVSIDAGIDPETWTLGEQIHGVSVAIVTAGHRGAGHIADVPPIPSVDALVTEEPGICLCVLVADCIPVLLCDRSLRAVAAIHAGRKGIERNIIRETIEVLRGNFGIAPEELQVGVGPSIGACCYPVDRDVAEAFARSSRWPEGVVIEPSAGEGWKPRLNLRSAAQALLIEAGVPGDSIEHIDVCTACHRNRFFSHRGDSGHTGRFGAGIVLP